MQKSVLGGLVGEVAGGSFTLSQSCNYGAISTTGIDGSDTGCFTCGRINW